MFGLSPRLLEWATPYAYAIAVLVLLLTLAVGTGGGTAASSKSWITLGGLRLGQPAELAKLAVILMLARWLAERREPPATLRDLVYPSIIVGVPFALVVLQPDLGSAIVFIAILFGMLFWAGTKASLLLLFGSPAIGLVLAFSTAAWGAWIILLFGLLLWWRPYVWEGLSVMLANIVMGVIAVPFWRRLARHRMARDSVEDRHRVRRLPWQGVHPGAPEAPRVPPRPAHRLHLSCGGRGARVPGGGHRAGAVRRSDPHPAADRPARHRRVFQPVRVRDRQPAVHPHRRKRGDDDQPAPHHRHPAAVLLVRGLVPARLLARGRGGAAGGLGLPPVRLR